MIQNARLNVNKNKSQLDLLYIIYYASVTVPWYYSCYQACCFLILFSVM